MSTLDGLLDAIRDDPGDDTPCLVLADWLDDHGDPRRAELIRVQCLLARLPDVHDRRPELEARERGLLLLHERGWADLPEAAVGTFRRGFLDRIGVPARLLLRESERLLEHGTVTELELTFDEFTDLERVAGLPALRSVRRLTLVGDQFHLAGVAALLDSPWLTRLEALTLWCRAISRRGLRRLGQALSRLRELGLVAVEQFGPGDLAALLPTQPSAVERLAFERTPVGAEAGQLLGSCRYLARLRDLRIADGGLTYAALPALARAAFAPGLERLAVSLSPHTVAGSPEVLLHDDHCFRNLRVLAVSGGPLAWDAEPGRPFRNEPHLRELSIGVRQHPFGEGLARWLCQPALAGLVALSVTPEDHLRWDVHDALIETLTRAPTLSPLRRLHLGTWLLPGQLAALLAGPNSAGWRDLELAGSDLGGELDPLVGRDDLQLRRLALPRCSLVEIDIGALADCPRLADLRQLDLSGNGLGDRAVDLLVESPYLRRLTSLDLSRNRITDAGAFVGSYLANPAILNLADNPLSDGTDALLRAGVEAMRAALAVPVLADLSEGSP